MLPARLIFPVICNMNLSINKKGSAAMIIPKPLSRGSRVALIDASGPVPEERLAPAVASVRALGLEPVVYPSCRMHHGYLAGYDRERAQDLNDAFADPSIDGIICIRGGYGAQRLLDRIDWDTAAKNPKVFCGYSDVTILHLVLNQRCGFVTYHTPMPATEWYTGLDAYTERSLRNMLFGVQEPEVLNPPEAPMATIAKGVCRGVLVGGNLSLISSTLGTPYEIDTKDKILFIEEIGESPYRIDRMLLMLKQAGKLRVCAGIVLGAFTDCGAPDPEKSLTLREVFTELLLDEGKPILGAVQCGHILPTMSLPLGVNVSMDATNRTLQILEY